MAGTNVVILRGRVGNDPEVKRFNDGNEIAEFSLATSKTWKDRDGNRKEKTEWHKIKVLNNSLIENVIRPYVNKGSLIGIEGELDNEEWEKDGQKRQATKVVVGAFSGSLYLLGSKDDNGGDRGSRGRDDDRGSRSSGRYSNDDSRSGGYQSRSNNFDDDAEIPF